jgi:hypothetical protein
MGFECAQIPPRSVGRSLGERAKALRLPLPSLNSAHAPLRPRTLLVGFFNASSLTAASLLSIPDVAIAQRRYAAVVRKPL